MMRIGLRNLVQKTGRFQVIGETSYAPTARKIFAEAKPDVVIMGLTLKRGDGVSLLKDFRKMNPAAGALVITRQHDPLSIQRAFRAGARGYVSAEDEIDELLRAVDCVARGELHASEMISHSLLGMLASGSVEAHGDECAILSDRELQVFRLIGSGFGTSRLAGELHLSVKTVETHRQRIKQKLRLTNGAELTQRATQWLLQAARTRRLTNRKNGV